MDQGFVFYPACLEIITYAYPSVFRVQRVSRQFRDLVATSAAIQQKLFLRSSGGERRTWVLRSSQAVGAFNWIVPCDAEFIVCTDLAGVEEKEWTPARLNPLYVV
jgi:hypothetical protein